jgi:hypothetical protein
MKLHIEWKLALKMGPGNNKGMQFGSKEKSSAFRELDRESSLLKISKGVPQMLVNTMVSQ